MIGANYAETSVVANHTRSTEEKTFDVMNKLTTLDLRFNLLKSLNQVVFMRNNFLYLRIFLLDYNQLTDLYFDSSFGSDFLDFSMFVSISND